MNQQARYNTETHTHPDFPLSIYTFRTYDCGGFYAHFHDHFEILYVAEGSATVQIGDHIYHGAKGDVFLTNMYQIHSVTSVEDVPSVVYAIVFHRDMLDNLNVHDYHLKFIEPFLSGNERFPDTIVPGTDLHISIRSSLDTIVSEYMQQDTAYEIFIKTAIERIFASLYRYRDTMPEGSMTKVNRIFISQVAAYVQDNYMMPITLSEIAQHTGMNPSYFCRLIKKLTGSSFTQFLNIYRVQQAEKMLSDTSDSISLISEKAGFSNLSYFNRLFKSIKGMTPSAFRKSI